ncbi:hypothetical protein SS50377_22314 [Spironucleus salmonicida]|uniref:Uncharacterized protein n=1 Tax=Spironucleus salmonicida TaxID=348837 RepID=V6LCM0_9EUKA|nr:hypothetical protein SS50377_22314 [Spironucleus salmonicida]|eukprot:EST42192.1 Hypothetical protein SS50377_18496 [Spironucleus salmonicida]
MIKKFQNSPIQQILNSTDIQPFNSFKKFTKIEDLISYFDPSVERQVQLLLEDKLLTFTGTQCLPQIADDILCHIGSRNQIYYDFDKVKDNTVISCQVPGNLIQFSLSSDAMVTVQFAKALLSANQILYSKFNISVPLETPQIIKILEIQNNQKRDLIYVKTAQRRHIDYSEIQKKVFYQDTQLNMSELVAQLIDQPPADFVLYGYKRFKTVDFDSIFTLKPLYNSINHQKLYRMTFRFQMDESLNLNLHSNIDCKVEKYPVKISSPDTFTDIFDLFLGFEIVANKESFYLTNGNIQSENWIRQCNQNFLFLCNYLFDQMDHDQREQARTIDFGESIRQNANCFIQMLKIINEDEYHYTISEIAQIIKNE